MHSLAELHAPEFLEIAVTMPQAKLLYLLGAVGRHPHVRPRRAARRLAVHGQRPRRPDRRPGPRDQARRPGRPPPGGRRPHRAGHGLPRPLPRPQRRPDARRCSASSTTTSSPASAAPSPPSPAPPIGVGRGRAPAPRERIPHEPPVRARRRQAERHAAAGRRPVHRGHRRVGQPPAGAPAGHRAAGDHRDRAAARRRRGRRRRPGDQADRARDLGRPAAPGPPVHVRQLDRARRRAVLVRHRHQGDARARSSRTSRRRTCRRPSTRPSPRSTSTRRRSSSRRSPRRPRTA